MFSRNARKFLCRLTKRSVQRVGQESRVESVRIVQKLSFAADEQRAATLIQLFIAQLFWPGGQKTAVVPSEFDWRYFTACRKVVEGHRRVWIGSAVERCRDRFNRSGQAEIKRPHRNINQVRAHIANRPHAPISPATPVKGMIDRVIRDLWCDAQKKIPVEAFRHRKVTSERGRQARVHAGAVPAQRICGNFQRLRARHALWPESQRTIGPNVYLAYVS